MRWAQFGRCMTSEVSVDAGTFVGAPNRALAPASGIRRPNFRIRRHAGIILNTGTPDNFPEMDVGTVSQYPGRVEG